ncbi:MAG: hypothetical protein ABEJ92_00875 [Halobacteriales archaeon]
MAHIRVPPERRPFVGKYVGQAAIGLGLVGAFVWFSLHATDAAVVGLGIALVGGVGTLSVLVLVVEAVVRDWFAAAEVVAS